jgi:hypothetical protein
MLELKNIFWDNFGPASVTLTLSRQKSYVGFAHNLAKLKIWAKIEENLSISVGLTLEHDILSNIWLFDIWPSIVTLILSWHTGNIGSAHPLVEVNICAKFKDNLLISVGLTQRTRHTV